MLQGCCWTDHSDVIKEVAVPMQQELEKFYKENKRFPSTEERDEILQIIGCKMDGDICTHNRERMWLFESRINADGDYVFDLRKENTLCFFFIDPNKAKYNVGCRQQACVSLKQ